MYATDVAKMVQAPIFHVNGDDPEACARVARLAFAFRQRFHKDVVIDMVCYRRMGHNEGDDPRLTQPKMYERIDNRRTVRKIYTEALIKRGDISLEDAEKAMEDFSARLSGALEETRSTASPKFTSVPPAPTERLLPDVATAITDKALLDRIANVVTSAPEGFHLNPKLAKVFEARTKLYAEGQVDWALGEAFAYGSLLAEGHDVRLAGQDSSRGTFGHRNAVLVDTETEDEVVPLNHLGLDAQGRFFLYDSLLSEYAALGFEYGYSVAAPDSLVLWEAQFGDFVNGAQIVIDQFIAAAEDKWGQSSGLVLLLPHGYEGQGPEHSSGRIERFLELCANGNMQVVNLTSASQLFHALRRQLKRTERKPLIVFTTKSGLRATWSRSTIADITERPVLRRPRRPRAQGRAVGRAAGRAGDGQGRLRRHEGAGQAVGAGRRRAGRAAVPVARGRDHRDPGPLRAHRRGRLAAGGAREHGRLDRSCTGACTSCCGRTSSFATSLGWRRAPRPRARSTCTSSRPST